MPFSPEQLDSYLAQNQERAFSDMARLCAIPSVSAKGQELEPCACLVSDLMEACGLDARLFPTPGGPPVVFGTAEAERHDAPTILFYNHYDVQPAEPLELWDSDAFTLIQREGKLFARGAADDKGHIISRLLALDALRIA